MSQHGGGLQEFQGGPQDEERPEGQPQTSAGHGSGQGPPARPTGRGRRGWPRGRIIAASAAAAGVLIGAGSYALASSNGAPAEPAVHRRGNPVTLPGPFRVTSIWPSSGDQQADGSRPVQVGFSAPLASHSPLPSLTPHVAGSWHAVGDTLYFRPAQPLSPSTTYTVTVPAGVRSAAGHQLAGQRTEQFTTETYSLQRLAEVLGQLGYLPMTWQQPYLGMHTASAAQSGSSMAAQQALAYDPPDGVYTWQQGYPPSLAAQWQPSDYNVILRGAVMAFQSQHNMNIDGDLTPALWNALFQADMAGQGNTAGYTYAVADKTGPERLTIWHDGQVVLSSPANTGIGVAPTADGTFPVYEKFQHQIMRGINPDGSHYADPVSWVSYFNGGDAVHYFPRGDFGSPQSLGCVELPYAAAEQSYPYLTYGSLVTVSG